MLRVLDLFSGIGGFSLGLERTGGFATVGFCEIAPYCRTVLAKHWPDVPIYDDVRTIPRIGAIDVVCGGFPCQPASRAGKRLGRADDRWLWPAMVKVIGSEQPSWVLGENAAGILDVEIDQVLSDLENLGYACWAFAIPAGAVGSAPHRRERVWILAHAERGERRQESHDGAAGRVGREQQPFPWDRDWEVALREFRGVDDGSAYRVDRVDTIRNAVIPQIPEIIGRAILAAEGVSRGR